MGKRLVIAEKPMLAKAILDAIPGTAKSIKAGERVFYTEKGDYLVVALAGHVLQLKEPEDYDPKYKKWTLEDLPIFFPDWAAVPAQGKSDIVRCVKSLLPQADSVIHAGDVDDEGQLIVDELLRYCGYRGKVQRLYTSDTSTAALKKRLGMLEDNAKWEPLGVSAYARSVTDKTFGINFSRLYTKLNGTLLTVGRVQTPAMGLVVARDEAIENHVARKYYALEVQAEIDGRQPYIPAEFSPTKGSPLLGEEDKVWERKGLEEVLAACRGKNFPAKVSKKEETEAPPLPFNLNKLNLYCSSRWGYDPQQVMEITQSLREKYRAITYNRSDSQYLTTEQFREAPDTVSRTLANLGMQIPEIDTNRKSRCFDDSKVSAHTAIIPTNEAVNVGAMTQAEQNVYKAICGHYLIQFMPGCKKRKTNLRIDCPQGMFSATSVEVIDKGFKAVIRAGSEDKAPGALSGFAAGDYRACIMDGSVTEHETTPPRRYTKATLAADMSSVAIYVQDPQIKATLIRKDDGKEGESGSIGTGATRPAIIEGLVKRGFLREEGKYVISTELGRQFYRALPDEIKKPDVTAEWWLIQENIKDGKAVPDDLFKKVLEDFETVRRAVGTSRAVSAAAADKSVGRKTVGVCPRCGKPVVEGSKGFGCSGYKDGCGFVLWMTGKYGAHKVLGDSGKKVTSAMAEKLLSKGKVLVKGLTSAKGTKYDAWVCMEDTGRGVFLKLSFDDLPQKKGKKRGTN